jgi:hypothetical protein
LPARISETVGFAGLAKCGGAKYHKGRKPDWCFAEPEPPEWAVSANRLLCDVGAVSLFYLSKYFYRTFSFYIIPLNVL